MLGCVVLPGAGDVELPGVVVSGVVVVVPGALSGVGFVGVASGVEGVGVVSGVGALGLVSGVVAVSGVGVVVPESGDAGCGVGAAVCGVGAAVPGLDALGAAVWAASQLPDSTRSNAAFRIMMFRPPKEISSSAETLVPTT